MMIAIVLYSFPCSKATDDSHRVYAAFNILYAIKWRSIHTKTLVGRTKSIQRCKRRLAADLTDLWLAYWIFFLTFGSCKLFTISKYETYLRFDLQIKSIWYIGANGKWVAIARTWEIVLGRNMSGSIWFLFLYKNRTIRSLKVNSSFNHSGTIVSQTKWKAPLFNNLFCFFIHSGTTSVLVPSFPRITRVFVLTV